MALALKYRPELFEELVCPKQQLALVTNSVIQGSPSQAFLLSGPRAVGKTSLARIFARALNCSERKPDEFEPCNKCLSCLAITEGSSRDVSEIDAASENSVAGIRELMSNLGYHPLSKWRVIILDESHELTSAASNALLKTLEEPPEYVIFIFCTTEPEAVLDTIRSRCFQVDLPRIRSVDVIARLRFVADAEAIPVDEEALAEIARFSEGGMRDALNLLEYAQLLQEECITVEMIDSIAGRLSIPRLFELLQLILARDYLGAMRALQKAFELSGEVTVAAQLLRFSVNALAVKFGTTVDDFDDTLVADMKRKFGRISVPSLTATITTLRDSMVTMKSVGSVDARIIFLAYMSSLLFVKEDSSSRVRVSPKPTQSSGLSPEELLTLKLSCEKVGAA